MGGCASGDYRSGPTPPTTTTTLAPEVTVRAAVAVFSPSARVVTLDRPVDGFASVALAADTEVVRAGGARATVADLVPRASFDVTGRPGAPGTLVARRIVLL